MLCGWTKVPYLVLKQVAGCPVLQAHAHNAGHHDDAISSAKVQRNACWGGGGGWGGGMFVFKV